MAHILHRDRWRTPPPPGWRLQFGHPLAAGVWAAIYYSGATAFDALRGQPSVTINPGNNQAQSRGYRGGRYFTANRPGGATPYFYAAGRTATLAVTSDVTLVGLFGGDGRATFPTVRAKLSSVFWQEGVPAIQEGDGTNNVPVAKFYGAGNVTVQAAGTSLMPGLNAAGRVIAAEYDNGTGISVWADGIKEGFTSSSLNLALVPDEMHLTGGTTIMEYPPVLLAYSRVLSDGEHRALAENPFQMLRPARRPSFFVMGGGGGISGQANIVDAVDTVSSEGALTISGSASITDALDTASADSTLSISGQSSITDELDTASSAGQLTITGAASITDALDTVAATGTLVSGISGQVDIVDDLDTVTATATVSISGQASISDDADTVTASASLSISGQASITDALDTVSAQGAVTISGQASIGDDVDTVSATGVLGTPPISGEAYIVDALDTVTATATLALAGQVSVVDALDTVSAQASLAIVGQATILDAPDTVSATGTTATGGALSAADIAEAVWDELMVPTSGGPIPARNIMSSIADYLRARGVTL